MAITVPSGRRSVHMVLQRPIVKRNYVAHDFSFLLVVFAIQLGVCTFIVVYVHCCCKS
jgi:hypothetical protein